MDEPTGREVVCPNCRALAMAIVPRKTTIVPDEEASDGKVWVNCRGCGERFLAYYTQNQSDRR